MSTETVRRTTGDLALVARGVGWWSVVCYLLVTAAVVGIVVVHLDGGFAYVVDDAAIHLGMAKTLVNDATWGVADGSFQSASSSPLWTVLVAAGLAISPVGDHYLPLVLNVGAGVGVVLLVTRGRYAVLRPSRDPVDLAAIGTVVVVALFLPGLAVVGMEHSLQVLLVLAAVILVQHASWQSSPPVGRQRALILGLLAVAALTRFETMFVAVGLAAGLVTTRRRQLRFPVEVLLAVGLPVAAFGVWNKAMGGGWLPNSVLSKAQGVGASNLDSDESGLFDVLGRLTTDPLLVALVSVAVAYLVLTTGTSYGRFRLTAVTLVIAASLHAVFADVGWFERYQAYLVALGTYLALGIVGELPAASRRRALVAFSLVVLLLGSSKLRRLSIAHTAADDIYRHHEQAGRFLDRYYDGEPVATDQLGYVSFLHDGPVTDLGGLGDYEVLTNFPRTTDERHGLFRRLADERGFRVVVLYDVVGAKNPPEWSLVGSFDVATEPIGAVSRHLQFFATTSGEAEALRRHLQDFADDLPPRVTLTLAATS